MNKLTLTTETDKFRSALSTELDSPIREALTYLRNAIAQRPSFGSLPTKWEVINIEVVNQQADAATLCLDLSDGTTIRLDVNRYNR